MSDNGEYVEVLKVVLYKGSFKITFAPMNKALISHALRMASLEYDNAIIAEQYEHDAKEKESSIIAPGGDIINRIRGENA